MNRSRFYPWVCFTLAVLLVLWSPLHAADLEHEFTRALSGVKLGKTKVSLCVLDVTTGRTLVSIEADEPMIPASNMKLVTSAAALGVLGPQYTFRTELRILELDAQGRAVLLVKGDGDPALADSKLLEAHQIDVDQAAASWVSAIQQGGVRSVSRLIIDDRAFDRQFVHPTWPTNQLNSWYCAQVAGINFYTNCLDVFATPQEPGQVPKVTFVPEVPWVTLVNRSISGGADNFIITRKPDTNEFVSSGNVKNRTRNPVWVTIHDPPIFFAQFLAHRMGSAGIPVSQIERVGWEDRLPEGKPLPDLQRSAIGAIVQRCNKDSQNMFAEALLKRMGRQITGTPGTWNNGAAAVRQFMAQRLGPKAVSITIADGSGMSRDNRVTAGALVDLLAAMMRDPRLGDVYFRSMAVAGVDGTLTRRLNQGLRGTVHGKTGYISGVSTISGVLVLPPFATPGSNANANNVSQAPALSNRMFAFSLLFNDIEQSVSVHDIRNLQDRLIRLIDEHVGP